MCAFIRNLFPLQHSMGLRIEHTFVENKVSFCSGTTVIGNMIRTEIYHYVIPSFKKISKRFYMHCDVSFVRHQYYIDTHTFNPHTNASGSPSGY